MVQLVNGSCLIKFNVTARTTTKTWPICLSIYFIWVKINSNNLTSLNRHAIYSKSLITPELSLKLLLTFELCL